MKPFMHGASLEKQKRLLLLGSQMETGGAQRVLLNQAAWFHEHGYAVTVAFLYDKENVQAAWQEKAAYSIVNLHARKLEAGRLSNLVNLIGGVIRAWRLICGGNIDAIETFTHHSNLIGLPLAWLCGVPVRIATHHGRIHNFPVLLQKLHSWMINRGIATKLVAVTEPTRQAAIDEGIQLTRIEVIQNGVQISDVSQEIKDRIRTELDIPLDGKCLISVGRLAPEKGHAVLIEAFSYVAAIFPSTHLVLAGGGALMEELKSQAKTGGFSEHIHFLGVRNNIPELLAASDLFILPSHSEGLPMALLEALATGIPTVCTAVGGVPTVIQDSKTGRLVPPNDPVIMAKVIAELLNDESQCQKLSQAGKLLIEEKYSVESMCRKYEQLMFP
jgi:glycosyltransferase involved in cell wall biosynthesis